MQRLEPKSFKKYPVFFYYHKQGILSARHPIYLKEYGNNWPNFILNIRSLDLHLKPYTQNKHSDFPVLLLYHTNRGSRHPSLLKINAKLMDFHLGFQEYCKIVSFPSITANRPVKHVNVVYVSEPKWFHNFGDDVSCPDSLGINENPISPISSGILHILFDSPAAYSSLSSLDINTFRCILKNQNP